jgi:hypothetical protein
VEEATGYAPWPLYLSDVVNNLRLFSFGVSLILVAVNASVAAKFGAVSLRREASVQGGIVGVVTCCGLAAWLALRSSDFAGNMVSGNYRHGLDDSFAPPPKATIQYIKSLAAPEYEDVLISERMAVLGAQSSRLDYHPANHRWKISCHNAASRWMNYRAGLPPDFSRAVVRQVID